MSTEPHHRCTSCCWYHDDWLGSGRQKPIPPSMTEKGLQRSRSGKVNLAHCQMYNLWREQQYIFQRKKCLLSHLQAGDRIACDLVTHFPHATPHPPSTPPLVFPSRHPATKRWGFTSLCGIRFKVSGIYVFPVQQTQCCNVPQEAIFSVSASAALIRVRFSSRWPEHSRLCRADACAEDIPCAHFNCMRRI